MNIFMSFAQAATMFFCPTGGFEGLTSIRYERDLAAPGKPGYALVTTTSGDEVRHGLIGFNGEMPVYPLKFEHDETVFSLYQEPVSYQWLLFARRHGSETIILLQCN